MMGVCITYDVLGVQVKVRPYAPNAASLAVLWQIDFLGTSWDDPDNRIKCMTFFK